jgi:hypothetical protein
MFKGVWGMVVNLDRHPRSGPVASSTEHKAAMRTRTTTTTEEEEKEDEDDRLFSVYTVPMPKKRVNITIDEDIHSQTAERLKMVGMDFSSIVEQSCLSFLAASNDLFKRFKQVDTLGDVSPGEIRVLMLQALGHMNMQIGAGSANVIKELEDIETRQSVAKTMAVEPIHTVTPKKSRNKTLKN